MGITTEEAIALINQLVPPSTRLPALGGHAGHIPRVTTNAAAVHLVDPATIADEVTASWAQAGQDPPGNLTDAQVADIRRVLGTISFSTGGDWQLITDAALGGWLHWTRITNPTLTEAAALTYVNEKVHLDAYNSDLLFRVPAAADTYRRRITTSRTDDPSYLHHWPSSKGLNIGTTGGWNYHIVSFTGDNYGWEAWLDFNSDADSWLGDVSRSAVYDQLKAIVKGAGAVKDDDAETITIA